MGEAECGGGTASDLRSNYDQRSVHPLDPVREKFLSHFREAIANARNELDQFATELLLELPSLKHDEYCYRLYRADIVGKKEGKSKVCEIALDEQEVHQWKNVFPDTVRFATPIVWYGIEFEIHGAAPDIKAIQDWTTQWLDIADARYVESAEFQEVAHSVTPPKMTDSGYVLSVDFGSAPTRAFDELIQIVAKDAHEVSVGSFSLFPDSQKQSH
jgi:hypothetical protein